MQESLQVIGLIVELNVFMQYDEKALILDPLTYSGSPSYDDIIYTVSMSPNKKIYTEHLYNSGLLKSYYITYQSSARSSWV